MKILILLLTMGLIHSCKVEQSTSLAIPIHSVQTSYSKGYADKLNYTRKLIAKTLDNYATSDTLFMVERVAEESFKMGGALWNNTRKSVFLFSDKELIETRKGVKYGLDTLTVNYSDWQDYLKDITEKFDTSKVDPNIKVLGGARVFITQVIKKKEVKTFFFPDQSLFVKPDKK